MYFIDLIHTKLNSVFFFISFFSFSSSIIYLIKQKKQKINKNALSHSDKKTTTKKNKMKSILFRLLKYILYYIIYNSVLSVYKDLKKKYKNPKITTLLVQQVN